ncbi:hypothetical protein POM88_028795 [Heracleum sosnowskyi]|uniref:MATH domain-containing protein n=1 Tax=Heracleum sosnowskyi TaxID=360622 RepID=A0AAD8MH23_9APIA|nr:hypothetical protein POM88_028795 [Heracleum sosnowskyi]
MTTVLGTQRVTEFTGIDKHAKSEKCDAFRFKNDPLTIECQLTASLQQELRLVLYPNGNGERGGEGHISLYLVIYKTDTLPLGWEACVTLRMFVYDHKKDKYLIIQDDSVHQIRRFHLAKKECGFDRLILSLCLYPSGDDECKGQLSLYLELANSPLAVKRVLADFSLVIKNQLSKSHNTWSGEGDTWFSTTESEGEDVASIWGTSNLISLSDLKKEFNGFLLNDTIILEAKLRIKAEVTNFS